MTRKIKMSVAVLNVRLHPHSQDIYASWIKKIYYSRMIANIHGDRYGMISSLDRSEASNGIVSGIITTFTKLEDGGSWFNAEELAEASEEQISNLHIPKHLYPNSSAYYFQFDLKKHKIYFQTYSKGKTLTPNSALRFFNGLAENLGITKYFKMAKLSIVQDRASLPKLFGLDLIKSISITILRPNTDIFDDDFERKIEAHLAETHSRKITISYQAEPGSSIRATQDIKNIGQVALDNGEIEVSGRNDTGSVKLNSNSFPLILQSRFDPDEQSELQAFRRLIPPRD